MTKYEAVRDSTQREVGEIVGRHLDGFHSEHFSREEAEDALGKTWSNVSDVSVTSGDVADVLEAVSELQESGFYVSIAAASAIVLEVSTSHDVFTRHHQRVMAQATAEADEAWAEDAPSGEAEHLSDEQVDAELTGYESVKFVLRIGEHLTE